MTHRCDPSTQGGCRKAEASLGYEVEVSETLAQNRTNLFIPDHFDVSTSISEDCKLKNKEF